MSTVDAPGHDPSYEPGPGDPPGRAAGARRAARVAGRQAGRTAAAAARGSAIAARATARRVRRATHAEGAGETGLGRLIELHGVSAGGDAMIAVALAGTLFFSVPLGEARGRVALYLLVTMAPFAVLAPVIGPALDRVRRGRRYAIAATLGLRAVLAWMMADALPSGGPEDTWRLYPAAFGSLVASRAYGVLRAAAVPRILPSGYGLVRANSRLSIAGLAAAAVAAGVAAGLSKLMAPSASLRAAALVFLVGAIVAWQLPRRLDAPQTDEARMSEDEAEPPSGTSATKRRRRVSVGPAVVLGVRANAVLRALAGFTIMFLAFRLRDDPVGGVGGTTAIALVAVAMGVGGGVGTAIGSRLGRRPPEPTLYALLAVVTAACALGAWFYGLPGVLGVSAASGLAQSLGKLSLDALVQRDVPEEVRASAFARSETVLQLGWVTGAGVGIVVPGEVRWVFAGVAVVLLAATVAVWQTRHRGRQSRRPHRP
jgi:MFS family permease